MAHKQDTEAIPSFPVVIGERGRIVLPAKLRETVGLKPGDRLEASVEADGSIKLMDRRAAIARLRGILKRPDGVESVVDSFLEDRRREAANE